MEPRLPKEFGISASILNSAYRTKPSVHIQCSIAVPRFDTKNSGYHVVKILQVSHHELFRRLKNLPLLTDQSGDVNIIEIFVCTRC